MTIMEPNFTSIPVQSLASWPTQRAGSLLTARSTRSYTPNGLTPNSKNLACSGFFVVVLQSSSAHARALIGDGDRVEGDWRFWPGNQLPRDVSEEKTRGPMLSLETFECRSCSSRYWYYFFFFSKEQSVSSICGLPFKKNIDGKVEQFIHTPTTPNSDWRQRKESYVCSLKGNNSGDALALSVGKKQQKHTQESTDSRNNSVQGLHEPSSKRGSVTVDAAPSRPINRMRSGVPVKRRNMQELVGLNKGKKLSMTSVNSMTGQHPLSRTSTKSSMMSDQSLHPLDNQSLKSFKRWVVYLLGGKHLI